MNTPWFTDTVAWLPGVLLGVGGGMLGGFAGFVLPFEERKKRWLPLFTRAYWLLLSYAAVLLILGIAALIAHQPYDVWYALFYPGVISMSSIGFSHFILFPRNRSRLNEAPNQALQPTAPSGRG